MQFFPLKIKNLRHETSDCVSIAFDVPDHIKPKFNFIQGQYLTLKTTIGGEEIRRSYSICSSPCEGELRIAVKRVEGGIFSTFANQKLKKGDILEVAAPDGRFYPTQKTHPEVAQKHYVLIAAGSGITPILSILKTALQTEPQSEVSLIYGNRNTASIIFREDIEGLKNKYMERLRVFHVLSRERMDSDLFHGRIDSPKIKQIFDKIPDILRGLIPKPRGGQMTQFFICGPEDMINDVRNALIERGIDRHNIHFELFGTNKKAATINHSLSEKVISVATIRLDGVSFDVPIHEGEAVLDAALAVGADLPFACKGGVCCTCRAKLTEGGVEMDVTYALDPEEVESGFILTCQSHPKTAKITVNFDIK